MDEVCSALQTLVFSVPRGPLTRAHVSVCLPVLVDFCRSGVSVIIRVALINGGSRDKTTNRSKHREAAVDSIVNSWSVSNNSGYSLTVIQPLWSSPPSFNSFQSARCTCFAVPTRTGDVLHVYHFIIPPIFLFMKVIHAKRRLHVLQCRRCKHANSKKSSLSTWRHQVLSKYLDLLFT